jgi:hypothetical protein
VRDTLALVIDRGVSAEVGKINKELGRLAKYEQRVRWIHTSSEDYSGLLNEYISLKLRLHVLRKSLYYPHDAYMMVDDAERILARCEELRAQVDAAKAKKDAAIWGHLGPPPCDWPNGCLMVGEFPFKENLRFCKEHQTSGPKAVCPPEPTQRWVQDRDTWRLERRQCTHCSLDAVGWHRGLALCSQHRQESFDRCRREKAMRKRDRYFPRTGGVLRPVKWMDRMADLFGEVQKGNKMVDFVYMSPQDAKDCVDPKYLWGAVIVRDPRMFPGRVRLNDGQERTLYSVTTEGTYFVAYPGTDPMPQRTPLIRSMGDSAGE